jgi:adenylate cyclase
VPGWLAERPSSRIEQGYVTARGDSVQVRVRREDGAATLTVKRGTGLVREETEVALDADAADRLWALTAGRRVQKRRHRVDERGMTVEVDVYEAGLAGLVVAEVEFASEAAAAAYEAPGWLGRELTGDRAFDNESLAELGLPESLG